MGLGHKAAKIFGEFYAASETLKYKVGEPLESPLVSPLVAAIHM